MLNYELKIERRHGARIRVAVRGMQQHFKLGNEGA